MDVPWLGSNDDTRAAVESLMRIDEEDCFFGFWEEEDGEFEECSDCFDASEQEQPKSFLES